MSSDRMDQPGKARMMIAGLPADEKVITAMGRVTIRHGQLDNVLRMVIKTLTGAVHNDALDQTKRVPTAALRDRVMKHAERALGDDAAVGTLQAILKDCERVSERRHELTHSVWGIDVETGEPFIRNDQHQMTPLPSVAELDALADRIFTLHNKLAYARFDDGFLITAVNTKRATSSSAPQ
jgi:hypothetical protein